jgi:predicted lipoprotein with Yx(FWY)xxD motif
VLRGWLLALALVPAVVAGCGGDSDPDAGASSGSGGAQATEDLAQATVISRDVPGFGDALATSDRRPVYVSTGDSEGKSTCTGACAKEFPPLEASGELLAGPGVDPGKLSSFKRSDGMTQVAFDGQPLYTSSQKGLVSSKAGEDLGGQKLYLVNPDGDAILGTQSGGY